MQAQLEEKLQIYYTNSKHSCQWLGSLAATSICWTEKRIFILKQKIYF